MGTRPKKRFSQNFLADKNIARKIVGLLELDPGDRVMEIGSGRGTLTELIAEHDVNLVSFEIDRQLMDNLYHKFENRKRVTIVNEDFLNVEPGDYFDSEFKLIGNIPYDITSPLLDWIIKHRSHISRAVLTTQKELGERIASGPGSKNWAPLSIFCQCHFDIRMEFIIPPKAFYPPPKVYSCTLSLTPREEYEIADWGNFEEVVRQAFLHRRKQLANNLAQIDGMDKKKIKGILEDMGFEGNIRAEAVSIQEFINLAEKIKTAKSS